MDLNNNTWKRNKEKKKKKKQTNKPCGGYRMAVEPQGTVETLATRRRCYLSRWL